MNFTNYDDHDREYESKSESESDHWYAYSHLSSVVSANVVTIIAFGISTLLLCTHLIVYSITADMRTLTGNSLASFCFSLLLSYCAFIGGMVVRDTNSPCAVVAMLAFYFSLANSSWLLSISVQLYNSAVAESDVVGGRPPQRSARAFVWYSAFSWTEPALILSAALYVETYGGGGGGGSFKTANNLRVDMFPPEINCFNIDARVFAWFLVLCNVNLMVAFAVSAFAAFVALSNDDGRGGDNSVRGTGRGRSFAMLKCYMRLSLLAGFVWIVGMCMIYVKGRVLQIVFAVSNDALALYIFLAFTFDNKLSGVAFERDISYHMETYQKNYREYGGSGGSGGHPTVNAAAITSDV